MSSHEHNTLLERIVRAGRQNRISRRDFMAEASAAGLTIAAAPTLWAENAAAETPQSGGTFRLGLHDGNTADTLDPGKYQSVSEIQLAHTFRSYLTEITEDNGLGGDMAVSWSASPDARVWTFELSPDATFHDGRPFTSKDAVASLNHHRVTTRRRRPSRFSPTSSISGPMATMRSSSKSIRDLPISPG